MSSFTDFDRAVLEARDAFRETAEAERKEVAEAVTLLFAFLRSIGKFKPPNEWPGSREEDFLTVLVKSFEPMMGMLYLSESGLYETALSLKRNFAELMVQALAIGHRADLHVNWKYDRPPFNDFHKLVGALKSGHPKLTPQHLLFVQTLARYWNESSSMHSHMLGRKAVSGVLKADGFHLGVKIVNEDAEAKRLRTVRNMSMNMISLLIGVFDYGTYAAARVQDFPEATALIARWNAFAKAAEAARRPTT